MKNQLKKLSFFGIFLLLASACGGGGDALTQKKAELEEKKKQIAQLESEIVILEKEIQKADPSFRSDEEQIKLVSITSVDTGKFVSYVEVQGTVEADNNVILTAETNGIVRQIPAREGQFVGLGQLLVSQDSQVLMNNIAEVQKALELAEVVFQRQSKLWEMEVGTEIQYLEAKNTKERLERQLVTLRSQMNMSQITAPFSGYVDEIFIKKGQNAGPGSQLLRLVSLNQVNVVAEVSEAYLNDIKLGDQLTLAFPSIDFVKEAKVSLIGQTINPENRTFRIEMKLNNPDKRLKPDLIAKVRIKDQEAPNSVIIPTNLIQKDKTGEFVFVSQTKNKKSIAHKVRIERGQTYQNRTQILEGLQGGEKLIDQGFRDVIEGMEIKIVQAEKVEVAQN